MQPPRRSTLKPYYHPQRKAWYPRGSYYVEDKDGNPVRRRGFRGKAHDTRALCQGECGQSEAVATSGPLEPTFEEAVATYIQLGGDKRFLGEVEGGPRNKLLDFLGHYRVDEINDAVMARAVAQLYPNATAATRNRQLYTPVISVLRLAASGKPWKPNLKRPKGYSKLNPAKVPANAWFDALKKEAPPQLWALLLFLTLHGRRPSDGLRRVPSDFDPKEKTIMVDRDKNGNPILVRLSDPVVEAIQGYNWQAGPGLFSTLTWKARRNAYRMLKAACKRAAAPYITFHKAGRHKFAKRLLEAGYSLAHVKSAGRWQTIRVVAELYGHLEHSEVDEISRNVGVAWANDLGTSKENVVDLARIRNHFVTAEGSELPTRSRRVRYTLKRGSKRENGEKA
jgi:integrase